MKSRLIVIVGESGTGKSTVGQALANLLGYHRVEMSEIALSGKHAYERSNGPISSFDYVEKVLWGSGDYSVVARSIPKSLAGEGLIVTGPRRIEEVVELRDAISATRVYLLKVSWATRVARLRADMSEGMLRTRTTREATWGLLNGQDNLMATSVSNEGAVADTVGLIVGSLSTPRLQVKTR